MRRRQSYNYMEGTTLWKRDTKTYYSSALAASVESASTYLEDLRKRLKERTTVSKGLGTLRINCLVMGCTFQSSAVSCNNYGPFDSNWVRLARVLGRAGQSSSKPNTIKGRRSSKSSEVSNAKQDDAKSSKNVIKGKVPTNSLRFSPDDIPCTKRETDSYANLRKPHTYCKVERPASIPETVLYA